MTHMVTRCPKCATAFRVTTTQLESAKGSVRCGSCLHIFKAHDDLVSAAPVTPQDVLTKDSHQPPARTTEKLPEQPTDEPAEFEFDFAGIDIAEPKSAQLQYDEDIDFADDMLISDDMDEPKFSNSSYEFEGYHDMDLRPTQTKSLFEQDIKPKPEKISEEVDESWAEALLGEDEELFNALSDSKPSQPETTAPAAKPPAPQNLSAAIMERHEIEVPDASEYARINEEFSNLYKTPLFSIVNDTAASQQENHLIDKAFLTAHEEREAAPEAQPNPPTTFGTGFFRHRDEEELAHTQKHPLKSQPPMHATQDSRATLLKNIAPSPIELTAQRLRDWSQKTHWGVLSLLAALVLVGQIAYFKFDQLSLIEPYRTAYSWVCPIFNCKLPGLRDTSKIVAYQLILRNHPTTKNALLLDVMIRNDAEFEQPFPDLILAFTTMDEKPVASRRFKAKEYLSGELTGRQLIPSKQPVHVTLELSDPGAEAVNYHMSIAL